mmetsp:Transcript_7580/g.18268  ORF Transcript_7580/g.18268 Transcript_7580/m.18268 type:complete len:239 (-) Transcript_7580:583-1299(-)
MRPPKRGIMGAVDTTTTQATTRACSRLSFLVQDTTRESIQQFPSSAGTRLRTTSRGCAINNRTIRTVWTRIAAERRASAAKNGARCRGTTTETIATRGVAETTLRVLRRSTTETAEVEACRAVHRPNTTVVETATATTTGAEVVATMPERQVEVERGERPLRHLRGEVGRSGHSSTTRMEEWCRIFPKRTQSWNSSRRRRRRKRRSETNRMHRRSHSFSENVLVRARAVDGGCRLDVK